MRRKVIAGCIVAALAAGVMITGCASQANAASTTSATTAASTEEKQKPEKDDNQVRGQITAIDGDTITMTTMVGGGRGGEKPDGEKPTGEAPTGERPEKPSDESGSGEKPTGDAAGETKTITLTSSTSVVSRDKDTETAITSDDLSVGDMISVEMDGDTVVKVSLQKMPEKSETASN